MPPRHAIDSAPDRRVAVVGDLGQRSVIAIVAIGAGETALEVTGVTTTQPSRYSIEVGEREHVDLPPDLDPARVVAEYPWQFLNHSCDPDVRLVGRALIATRPIAPGEEITFDYNTTEFDMASPFTCRCGASGCGGRRIAGFRHLTPAERRALMPSLSDSLRGRVARTPALVGTPTRE